MAKLGFFDSGIGGLTVMRSFETLYPDFDMVYFGDRANCPYGNKSSEEIFSLVLSGVEFLISRGATIIILACNTAVSHAIWKLQNEVYPEGCGIKILWITLPGAEKVREGGFNSVCVLATTATVLSWAYRSRVKILSPNAYVQEIALPWLVDEIEKNPKIEELILQSGKKTEYALQNFEIECVPFSATRFLKEIENIEVNGRINTLLDLFLSTIHLKMEVMVLWCTHYPLVLENIKSILLNHPLQNGIQFVDPGNSAAEKFHSYLQRHPEYLIDIWGNRELYFTKK
jgi:glutamate racemase